MKGNFAKFLTNFRRSTLKLPKRMASCDGDVRGLNDGSSSRKQLTVSVEGNIGSGKTTFLEHFNKYPNLHVVEEPVHLWQAVRGHNLLDLMYQNPHRWSLTFQTYVQLTMVKAHSTRHSMPLKLMERSIYSAKYCFVENLYRSGKMPEAEYVVLTEWFQWIIDNVDTGLDLIVYLRTEPEVVHERVLRRKRAEETGVPLEYLRSLHELHDEWLLHGRLGTAATCPVLVLDANLPVDVLREKYDDHRDTILFARQDGGR